MRKMKIMKHDVPSEATLKLLLDYEVGGGKRYYDKYLSKFTWPGGYSGPTIGIGIDCAYYSKEELSSIFKFLPAEQVNLIHGSVGKTGLSGKGYARVLRQSGIVVGWDDALDVFNKITWKKFCKLTEKTFPGVEDLCPDAYGALVSLVFNRGGRLTGESRLEMRNIRVLVPKKRYELIAEEIIKMKRLWANKGLDGLLARRESEAELVISCK
jgi:hypothetical protein